MKIETGKKGFGKIHISGISRFSELKDSKLSEFARFIVLLMLALFGHTHAFGQNQDLNNEVRRLLTRAKAAFEIGEYSDALKEYQAVSILVPDFADIYKAIGDAYEKLGGEDNLQKAIESYKHYLSLSPDAEDETSIKDKIIQLEYIFEKVAQKNFILDDFNGVWVSDLANNKRNNSKLLIESTYRVDLNLTPVLIFRITEMGRTGRYRVEILKESYFYKESIIKKIVNIYPDKNNSIRFTFADEERYIPSQSKWEGLRLFGSILGQAIGGVGGDIFNIGVSAAANFGQEIDIPSNAQTVYDFELQYKDGALVGYCNVIQGYSSARSSKDTGYDFYEIKFWKENDYIEKLKMLEDEKKAKKPVLFGFFGGYSYYKYDTELSNPLRTNYYEDNRQTISYLKIGIFLEFRLLDYVYLQPGAVLSIGNGNTVQSRFSTGSDFGDDVRGYYAWNDPDSYFEVPINLLFKYKFGRNSLYAGLGPVIDFFQEEDCKLTAYASNGEDFNYNYYNYYNYESDLKRAKYNFNLKLGFSARAFFMEAGFCTGKNNISSDPNIKIQQSPTIFAQLGFKF